MKAYLHTSHPALSGVLHGQSTSPGELQVCDVPDGALLLEIGSCLNPSGGPDLQPIDWIDYSAGVYSRGGDVKQPIPEKAVKFSDLVWRRAESE